jgi:glutamyl-tRNA synthetase
MAVLNYLFAKKHGGTIIFRSEDTDRERSTREYEEDILDSLHWLGLSWDEFYRQSERLEAHRVALQKLIDAGTAYISEEESKKEAGKMVSIVRLRNPGKEITFHDIVRGDITFNTTELGDFAIARAIDDPLYHFAVVVDDADMGITHVIRGEDHISNTPRQILIQEALGYARPQYAHFPLHLSADRSKLSKRKGDVAVRSYREKGYLPDALLNYLATLGWTPPSGKEILNLQEMIQEFELIQLHKSGAVFDIEKLRWYNREYLQRMDAESLAVYILPTLKEAISARVPWDSDRGATIVPFVKERISISGDIAELAAEGEWDFFFADPQPATARIPEKKSTPQEAARHLGYARDALSKLDESDWNETTLKSTLWDYASREGRGAVLWPLRYALSGRDKSPDPFVIAGTIGKEATLRRIDSALELLKTI